MKIAHVTTVSMGVRYLLLNQLLAIKDAGYDVCAISADGPEIPDVVRAGIRHIAVPMTRATNPLADLKALLRLVWIMRRERFDIVHTHTPKAALLAQYAAWFARVPIRVHTIHGLYFPGHMNPRRRWVYVLLERVTMAPSHYNLSQNPEDVPVAIGEGISQPDRLELVGNGIDLNAFDPTVQTPERRAATRASLGLGPEHLVVGMVSRFVGEKGCREFLEAARTITSELPNVRFLMAGAVEPWKKDALHPEIIDEMGLAGSVLLLGHRTDMPELCAVMDVLALPSHREGFPRAPMEAAAMGVPSVVTDIRGCRQVVDNGVTGLIVPVKDSAALASALLTLLRDGELRRALGAAAREKALREFDEQTVFRRVVDAYGRLLGRRLGVTTVPSGAAEP